MPAQTLSTNLPGTQSSPLLAAWTALGGNITTQDPLKADLIVWEATAHHELTPTQIAELTQHIRQGASLLLSLSADPGLTPAFLGPILPTTAWATRVRHAAWAPSGEIAAATWDKQLFPAGEPSGLTFPYFFDIQPLAAAERGQGRIEIFTQTTNPMAPDGHSSAAFWTRSLLNRDWQVAIAAANLFASPLLVTGRYGAGRVAVLASSLTAAPEPLLKALRAWLNPKPLAAEPPGTVELGIEQLDNRRIRLNLRNPGTATLQVQPILRLLTWEGALITDLAPESPAATIPPNQTKQITYKVPPTSSTNYQALDFADRYQVRAGLLSASGANLLVEHHALLDFAPPLSLSVALDNLYATPTAPHRPSQHEPESLGSRMGSRTSAYAYPPGSTVNASATISNGLRNLAPLAVVADQTTPENPTLQALNDTAIISRKTPIDGIQAYSTWTGKAQSENVLTFTFPHAVMVSSVNLVANSPSSGNEFWHNPGAAIIELDDKPIARNQALDQAFKDAFGRAAFAFKPTPAIRVTVRLPWVPNVADRKRLAPVLGEVEILGSVGAPGAPVTGTVQAVREDLLTGEKFPLLSRTVTVEFATTQTIPMPFQLPAGTATSFYRITAEFASASAHAPLLAIPPGPGLISLDEGLPANAPRVGYIVTRGFRNVFLLGTGTAEIHEGWGQPDDLVWAYSRNLKQIGPNAKTQANRLYVSDSDMRHYSTPWRPFNNGEVFYDLATPRIVENMQKLRNWNDSDVAILGHSDRWDTGPEMNGLHSWQDFVEFDKHLREQGLPGLAGKTRQEIAADIHTNHEPAWQAWQLDHYTHAVTTLREHFAAAGKRLIISAQGLPVVATDAAVTLSQTIMGMSDDSTWGMLQNSIPLTTGRQLAEVAFKPVWKMATLLQWGYNTNVFNYQWHSPAGTTEPSRRHYMSRAWRAMVWDDGRYGSVYTFGFNNNAGVSYTMNENDWQQFWYMHQRHSLLTPQAPIGAGLVMSSSMYASPEHLKFACTEALDFDSVRTFARTFELLHQAGVSIPFAANAGSIGRWRGSAPLILVDLNSFSDAELQSLAVLQARGVPLAAFADATTLNATAKAIFTKPNTLLFDQAAATLTPTQARGIAATMAKTFPPALSFSEGIAGYGFTMENTHYLIAEDWLEQGRTATIRLRASAGATKAAAVHLNEHTAINVTREAGAWVVEVPMRPGDGSLIALRES